MKLNFSRLYGPEAGVQGEVPHRLFCWLVGGEATGTNTPRSGIANVCPTLQSSHELITETVRSGPIGWPAFLNCCTLTVLPSVPWTRLKKLFRSGVQPSYP